MTTDIRKALDLAAGEAQYLFPTLIDGGIRDYTLQQPVLYNAVTHTPWASNTYFIRLRTANPTASWSNNGGQVLPAATNTTHTRVSMPVAYLYTRGEVTGPMAKAAGTVIDALAMEIEAHSRALVDNLSTNIANGTGVADLYGIFAQIESADQMNAGGVLTMSGALSLAYIDEMLDAAYGTADTILASRAVRRKINSLLQAQQQFVDKVEVQAGFRVLAYDGVPIITDMHLESTTKIAAFRRADAKLLVHQDFMYEELAHTKDSTDFMIKWYGGFALEGRPVELTGFTAVANTTLG
jgi:HK97 family phage major capsid protein